LSSMVGPLGQCWNCDAPSRGIRTIVIAKS
jgi:hypothetical protein